MAEECTHDCSTCGVDCASREPQVPDDCTHDCSTCGADCASREGGIQKEELNAYSEVDHVIAVVSGKGGVGKSLVTALLAAKMQKSGAQSAVLDADITGPSIPKAFGLKGQQVFTNELGIMPVKTKTGVDVMSVNLLLEDETQPVVWRGPVIAGAVKQFWTDVVWREKYMFVDMPPGTGDVPLTVFQSIPVSGVIIVTSPQQLVGMVVEKAVNMAKMMDIPILGIVENMSYIDCPDCHKRIYPFGEGRTDALAAAHGLKVIGRIPIDPSIAAAFDAGEAESVDAPWLDDAVKAISELA